MSDPYAFDEVFDSEQERLNRVINPGQMATQLGVSDLDADPEQAARSIQLSKHTGVPAPVINADQEGFEKEHKTALVGDIIKNNPDIQNYINTYPMASKVSSDDYANLTELGRAAKMVYSIGERAWEGVKEGFGDDPIGVSEENQKKMAEMIGLDDPKKVGDFLGAISRSSSVAGLALNGPDIFQRLFGAGTKGIAKGAARGLAETGLLDLAGTSEYSLEREIGGFLEWAMMRGDIQHPAELPKTSPKDVAKGIERQGLTTPQAGNVLGQLGLEPRTLADTINQLVPYLAAKELPPPGVIAMLDEIKKLQVKEDLDHLKDAQKAARDSTTVERAPDAGEAFLTGVVGDRKIGIDSEAVRAMYGDKLPEPNDGILGWIPNLAEQLRVAETTGGDIEVPLAGWLSKMDPVVAKEFEEHVRMRPEGLTKFETSEGEVGIPTAKKDDVGTTDAIPKREPRSIEDLVRREGSFEPLGQVGDRGIRMRPANDTEISQRQQRPTYQAAADKQLIERYASLITEQGDFDYWRKIGESLGTPNGAVAARLQSRGGKTTAMHGLSGNLTIFHDGKMVVHEEPYPLAQVGDRGIRMEPAKAEKMSEVDRQTEAIQADSEREPKPYHLFDGKDQIGTVWLSKHPKEPNTVIIEDVYSAAAEGRGGANTIGYHAVVGMIDEIKREFPGTKKIGGFRISGAREKASFDQGKQKTGWVTVSVNDVQGMAEFLADRGLIEREPPLGTKKGNIGGRIEVEYRPSDLWTEKEHEVVDAVDKIFEQIAPGLKQVPVDKITASVKGINKPVDFQGVHYAVSTEQARAYAVISLMGRDALQTALHEAIHYLRNGFFTKEEWSALEDAAEKGDWIKKHKIDKRYPDGDHSLMLEEAIAEEYRNWGKEYILKENRPADVVKVFERIKELFYKLRQVFEEVFGKGVTFDDIFDRVSAGEVGKREPKGGTGEGHFNDIMGMATQAEEASMFDKAKAIGMTEPQFKKYMGLIEKRRQEDQARAEKRAQQQLAATKTEQWKENEPRVREEVTQQINQRPDVMADDFFRRGLLDGEKVKRQRFDESKLNAEQKKALGPGLYGPKGVDPDAVAGLFGYFSGEDMVNAMAVLSEARGDVSPGAYKSRLIRDKTQATMMKRYGVPEYDQLLKETREDIMGDTQMDMLAEEMYALAVKAGQTPLTKEGIQAQVKKTFGETNVGFVKKPEKFIREAGKAGRATELALLKGDAQEAFRQSQRQNIAAWFGREARKLEKELARFDRQVETWKQPTISSYDQSYLDQMHGMLNQIQEPAKRNPIELQGALRGTSLEKFVDEKQGQLTEINVAGFLTDPTYTKAVDAMTADEFRAVRDSFTNMAHLARDEKTVTLFGRKEDLRMLREEAQETADRLPQVYDPRDPGAIDQIKRTVHQIDASLIKIEQMFDWMDKNDPDGVFNRIFRTLAESKHVENDMLLELGEKLKDLNKFSKDIEMSKCISVPGIKDWLNGDEMHLTHKDLIGIMLNLGSESNYKKLTGKFEYNQAWHQPFRPPVLDAIVAKHATKAHWDFVQGVWDTFEHFWPRIEELSRKMSGIAPDKIEARKITTPFGDYRGGYYPLIKDQRWEGPGETYGRGIYGEDKYTRAIPAKGYTQRRTQADYPLELSPDFVTSRLKETIHDLAFREGLVNASRFFRDVEVRRSIGRGLGPEYLDQINPWMEHVANPSAMRQIDNQMMSGLNALARGARQRIVAVQLLYRASTVMKHGMAAWLDSIGEVSGGPITLKDFGAEMVNWYAHPWQFKRKLDEVKAESGELRHRMHNMDRDIGAMMDRNLGDSGLYANALHYGGIFVATADLMSALPTYSIVKKRALMAGKSEADAVYMAEKALRNAHGSTGVTDLPAIMRASETQKLFTIAYGFFNHNYNRIRTIGRLTNESRRDLMNGDVREAFAKFGKAAWMSTWYIVLMSIVEESISPLPGDEKEGWGKWLAKGMVHQMSSTVPYLRGFVGAAMGRPDPTDPINQVMTGILRGGKEGWKELWHQEVGTNGIKNLFEGAGYAFAIPGMGQVGTTGQFLWNLKTHKDRPKGAWGVARGLTLGKSNPHQRIR